MWVRNRINNPNPKHKRDGGNYSIKIVETKLNELLVNLNNIEIDVILNNLYKNFNNLKKKVLLKKLVCMLRGN